MLLIDINNIFGKFCEFSYSNLRDCPVTDRALSYRYTRFDWKVLIAKSGKLNYY